MRRPLKDNAGSRVSSPTGITGLDRPQAESSLSLELMWDGILLGSGSVTLTEAQQAGEEGIPGDARGPTTEEEEIFNEIKTTEQELEQYIDSEIRVPIEEVTNRDFTDEWFSHRVTVTFGGDNIWINDNVSSYIIDFYNDMLPDRLEFHTADLVASRVKGKTVGLNRPFATSDILAQIQFGVEFGNKREAADWLQSRYETTLDRDIDVNITDETGAPGDVVIVRFIDQSRVIEPKLPSGGTTKMLRDKNRVTGFEQDALREESVKISESIEHSSGVGIQYRNR